MLCEMPDISEKVWGTMTREQAIELVQQHLGRHMPADYTIDIVNEAVRQDDDWWYITVKPSKSDVKRYDYYNVLAEVEREIQDENESNNILLVPVASGTM